MNIPDKLLKYGKSEKENFQVIDTIGVPHPYCITPKHVAWAADHFMGRLGEDAIEDAEKNDKAWCDICLKANKKEGERVLPYKEHKQALLVACYKDFNTSNELKEEIQAYLVKSKDMAEADGYAGFAFMAKF